jgi:hypothetical protein
MGEKVNKSTSTWLDLSDEAFMLALCVRPENLQDPARWCSEMRSHAQAMKVGPTTVQESEQMMDTAIRLAEESAGIRQQHIFPMHGASGEGKCR